MTYLGHDNDFKKSFYSLNLFKAYSRHLLGVLPASKAFFEFLCDIFAFQKLHKCTCYSGRSSVNCPTFTKICPFLFTLYACSG